MHYVIIGNSAAAIGAVEGIRSRDKDNLITLISAEPHHTYSRPLISYFLGKKIKKDNMYYRSRDFYEKNYVRALLGRKVSKLNVNEQSLILEGNDPLTYDSLLLATGGTPFIPPIKGLRGESPSGNGLTEVNKDKISVMVHPPTLILPHQGGGDSVGKRCIPSPLVGEGQGEGGAERLQISSSSISSQGSAPGEGAFFKGNIFTFTTWDDAQRIAKVAKKGAMALIIGGGLIGLKACEGLLALGVKVTIVELAERVLMTVLDARGSHIMLKHLRGLGVKVITGNTVEEIDSSAGGERVAYVSGLQDGTRIESDLIIVAIGVRPNLELVQGTPIVTNRGILVDQHMETSVPGTFAAGDVAETQDIVYGTRRVIPIWPNAYQQGKIAGMNMVHKDCQYPGSMGMNAIEICGLPTISVGMVDAPANGYREYKNLTQLNPKKGSYRRFVIRENKLIAAILVGDIRKAGMFTGLIGNKVEIKSFINELLKDDFGYICLPDEMRREKLLAN